VCGASLFWACAYELLRRHPHKRPAAGDAAAVTALAAVVDYAVVPKRLRPGWEKVVSPRAIGVAYVAMAVALALSPRAGGRVRR
jgi:drug/metabolite transporter (DMT)-like permease